MSALTNSDNRRARAPSTNRGARPHGVHSSYSSQIPDSIGSTGGDSEEVSLSCVSTQGAAPAPVARNRMFRLYGTACGSM